MNAFSKEYVAKALDGVPATASKTLRMWVERARENGADALAEACETELAARGTGEFDNKAAASHAEWTQMATDLSLTEAIELAFREVPPDAEEAQPVIAIIAGTPGITHTEVVKRYGRKHVSLIIGHLVHDRFGFFRKWTGEADKMSDILVERETVGRSVTYRFKPEAMVAFRALSII